MLAKNFQKTLKSENAQKYLKNSFFCVCVTLPMCNPRIMRDSCVLQVAHAYIRGLLLCKLAYHARVSLLHIHTSVSQH